MSPPWGHWLYLETWLIVLAWAASATGFPGQRPVMLLSTLLCKGQNSEDQNVMGPGWETGDLKLQATERSQSVFTVPYREALSLGNVLTQAQHSFFFFPPDNCFKSGRKRGRPVRKRYSTTCSDYQCRLLLDEVAQRWLWFASFLHVPVETSVLLPATGKYTSPWPCGRRVRSNISE